MGCRTAERGPAAWLDGLGQQRACNIKVSAVGRRTCTGMACVGWVSLGALLACCFHGGPVAELQKVGILLEFGAANNLTADEVIVSAACSCAVCCRLFVGWVAAWAQERFLLRLLWLPYVRLSLCLCHSSLRRLASFPLVQTILLREMP